MASTDIINTEDFSYEVLPCEIWMMIFECCDYYTYCALSCTCKYFYDVIKTNPSVLENILQLSVYEVLLLDNNYKMNLEGNNNIIETTKKIVKLQIPIKKPSNFQNSYHHLQTFWRETDKTIPMFPEQRLYDLDHSNSSRKKLIQALETEIDLFPRTRLYGLNIRIVTQLSLKLWQHACQVDEFEFDENINLHGKITRVSRVEMNCLQDKITESWDIFSSLKVKRNSTEIYMQAALFAEFVLQNLDLAQENFNNSVSKRNVISYFTFPGGDNMMKKYYCAFAKFIERRFPEQKQFAEELHRTGNRYARLS